MFIRRETIEIPTFDRLVLLMCYVFCSVALHCIALHLHSTVCIVRTQMSSISRIFIIISNCIIKSDWGKKTTTIVAPITRFSISRNRLQSMYTFPFVRTFWLLKIMFSFTLISLNHLDFTFLICPLIFLHAKLNNAKTPSNSGRFNCFESNENWNENLATASANKQTNEKTLFQSENIWTSGQRNKNALLNSN